MVFALYTIAILSDDVPTTNTDFFFSLTDFTFHSSTGSATDTKLVQIYTNVTMTQSAMTHLEIHLLVLNENECTLPISDATSIALSLRTVNLEPI